MKYLFIVLGILSFQQLNAQDPLSFSVVGYDPAYCRTAGYQSGNGVVYAAAEGGTPGYTFEWKNLTSGETNGSSAWGGLNSGDYRIEITDAEGDFIIDTVHVDSISPIANMSIIGDVDGGPDYFTGDAPLETIFENNSENVSDAIFPDVSPRYYFRPTELESFSTSTTKATDFEYTYNYDGIWTATLVAVNKNGCTDTTHAVFTVNGTISIEENLHSENISIYTISNNTIQVSITHLTEVPLLFNLYSLNGALIRTVSLNQNITLIENDLSEGVYLYEIINPKTQVVLQSGKVVR